MLVLTRGTGQSILIGELGHIKFKILTNDGQYIRIGIDAPKDVPILREEVFNRNEKHTRTAQSSIEDDADPCDE